MFSKIKRFDKINIQRLEIEGFKAYKEREIFELGDITKIFADNGQGKTSIGEAISWAFLGSNLWGNDKADSLLMNNASKKMEVVVYFSDGEKMNKLVRKRNSITTIILNNKEVRQIDLYYMLGNKDIFLSIFNPMYFHSMNQKEAREFIVSILPEIEMEDIVEKLNNYELEYIESDLNYIHNNPNEYMKERRRKIKEIEEDLIYIEGILSTLKPYKLKEPIDKTALENLEKEMLTKKEKLEKLILEKHNLEKEKVNIENKNPEIIDTTKLYKNKLDLEKGLELIKIKQYEIDKDVKKKIITLENEVENLRKEYTKINNTCLKEGDSCPTCKTIISKHHIAILEEDVENTLKEITNLGKEKADELKNIIAKQKELEKKFNIFRTNRINEFENKIKAIDRKIEEIERQNDDNLQKLEIDKEKSIKKHDNKISLLDEDIKNITAGLKELEKRYYKLKSEKEIRENQIIENEEKSIKLQEKIEEHNKSIGVYKTQINIAQNYANFKVEMLSDTIHQNLKDVEIVLQKIVKSTGELKDTFEIRYKGRDFKVLSASEKIKAGLEVANLVINQTGLYYPIFIDNGESITKYSIENNIQIIETRVVEGKSLEINAENNINMAI